MPLTLTIARQSDSEWQYAWAGTSPYRIYKDGALLYKGSVRTSLTVSGEDAEEPPVLEVFDSTMDSELSSGEAYPDYFICQWENTFSYGTYKVEKNDGGWAEVASVTGYNRGYSSYKSPALADITTHDYRITPIDLDGMEGDQRYISAFIVKTPDPPIIDVTYSEVTHQITIEARA